MLEKEINTPADFIYNPTTTTTTTKRSDDLDLENYVMNIEKTIRVAHETARARLRTTEEHLKRDYDLSVWFRALDLVTVKEKCRKLSPSCRSRYEFRSPKPGTQLPVGL